MSSVPPVPPTSINNQDIFLFFLVINPSESLTIFLIKRTEHGI